MLNKILALVLVAAFIGVGIYFYQKDKNESTPADVAQEDPAQLSNQGENEEIEQTNQSNAKQEGKSVPDKAVAVFETTEGIFKVTLDGKSAPKTVENFIKLVKDGFYNNQKVFRIEPNFVIQAGDPRGDGTGGVDYTVPAEISLPHKKGAIAMARLPDMYNPERASSGSQFYITLDDNLSTKSLDGGYTVFGYVTSGMDVVTKIGNIPTEPNPDGGFPIPLKEIIIKKITIGD
jgi:cyclophilin family peptidyl-prolyl cis-trans isomerase